MLARGYVDIDSRYQNTAFLYRCRRPSGLVTTFSLSGGRHSCLILHVSLDSSYCRYCVGTRSGNHEHSFSNRRNTARSGPVRVLQFSPRDYDYGATRSIGRMQVSCAPLKNSRSGKIDYGASPKPIHPRWVKEESLKRSK